jgi:DNA polymerase-4
MSAHNNRILHIDGDSFFASCEIALDPKLEGRPVWVGGGRRGDGIVIAANRLAKKYGIKTGTACFEAKRLCPSGVLCRPHYDAYRELSRQMFLILEEYAPTLVPYSIDEGFLDFSTMDSYVWRNTTPTDYVQNIRKRILKEVRLPVSAGLANSAKLAKLATDAAKPTGFLEVPPGREKDFLNDRPVQELSGIAKNRQRSLTGSTANVLAVSSPLPVFILFK